MNATQIHYAINGKLLASLKKQIAKSGPLSWEGARLAMFRGAYDRRDAGFHNQTIQEWITNGEVKLIELPNGDSLIA